MGLFGGWKLIRLLTMKILTVPLLRLILIDGYRWASRYYLVMMMLASVGGKHKGNLLHLDQKKTKRKPSLVRWRWEACFIESNHVDSSTWRYLLSLFLTNATHSTVSQRAWWWSRQLSSPKAHGKINGSTVLHYSRRLLYVPILDFWSKSTSFMSMCDSYMTVIILSALIWWVSRNNVRGRKKNKPGRPRWAREMPQIVTLYQTGSVSPSGITDAGWCYWNISPSASIDTWHIPAG